MKEKIKTQKGFIPIVIAILMIIAVGIGTSYGIIYSRASNVIKEAQLLSKEEKYNEAIEKLESVQNRWFIKNLGIKKQAIATELEKNKKLLEDKTEYTQGIEEFNKGNWEKAKELLSKVSELSPYYQNAKNKIEEAQNNIVRKQIAEAVEKVKKESSQEVEEIKKEIKSAKESAIPEAITISSADIEPYLTGVGRIDCKEDYSVEGYSNITVGSGSLWNLQDMGYVVLTNKHVVIPAITNENGGCTLSIPDAGAIKADKNPKTSGGFWWIGLNKEFYTWNNKTDIAIVKIGYDFVWGEKPTGLNYSIGSLSLCKTRMPLNSPVVVIGFPATTFKYTENGVYAFRTVTNGVISAYDESAITKDKLPFPNYFVSAKIDSGNSGGIALSKDSSGICLLGVPTWISLGAYETQGIIQNIHNVMYVSP